MTTTAPAPAVILGEGAIDSLDSALDRHAAGRVFFVVDRAAYTASGAASALASCFKARDVVTFDEFSPNPKLADVEAGLDRFRAAGPDLVLALGGGTAIDTAKLIAGFAAGAAPARELATGAVPLAGRAVPLVAVPTTAGTGSEATHFAVVYVDGRKHSVAHPSLLPDDALIDPRLTHSLPPGVTAATGLDAFCQAVESIWAVGATGVSIDHAAEAARLAMRHLPAAVLKPTPESRAAMCRAAHLAGRAINVTKTTLPHALSYGITARHGVPHGVAAALTLAAAYRYNSAITEDDCLDPRGPDHVRGRLRVIQEVLGAADVAAACAAIRGFVAGLGCPATPRDAGVVTAEGREALAGLVNAERLANNPRAARRADLVRLLADVD